MKLDKILVEIKLQNIKNLKKRDILKIRLMRNEKKIRENMVNTKVISLKEHLKWYKQFNNSKSNFFYVINYKKKFVGGLGFKNYSSKKQSGEWSFYISEKKNTIGLGASVEFLAINYFFDSFKLKKLCCFVLNHNLEVTKLHKKFGFKEIKFNEYKKNIYLAKELSDAIYLSLEKKNWYDVKDIIYRKYFLKNEKK